MPPHKKEEFCTAGIGVHPDHCGCIEIPVEELENLRKFLDPKSVYFNGHPQKDDDVIALRENLDNVLAHAVVESALAVIKNAVSDGGWFMLVLKEHQTVNDSQEFKDALSWCERIAAWLSIKAHGVSQMPDVPAAQHAEIAHMRGLLGEMGRLRAGNAQTGGLSHLGAHHTGILSRAWGYNYSIPLTVFAFGATVGNQTKVFWKWGKTLESAVKDKYGQNQWWELKDDEGVVYYSFRTPALALADFAALQREMENNADSKRRLLLTLKPPYDYSISLRINQVAESYAKITLVTWNKGGSLERAIENTAKREQWVELKDNQGALYYLNSRSAKDMSDLSALQREIENNPDSKKKLILLISVSHDLSGSAGGDWWANTLSF